MVSKLTANATREKKLSTTNDWSFVSERLTGENWFLVGECAGFADPILAAGLSLAHLGARDVAYVILALERHDYEPEWLRNYYCSTHRYQIRQHMRFADFWYTANGVFSDLKDHARQIALDAGLELTADKAWQWLGQGGFIERNSGTSIGGYGLFLGKQIISSFTGDEAHYEIVGKSHFLIDLDGAEKDWTGDMNGGRITRRRMYRRNGKLLPMIDVMGWLVNLLKTERTFEEIVLAARSFAIEQGETPSTFPNFWKDIMVALEAMIGDGWVKARSVEGARAVMPINMDFTDTVHANRDEETRK
jgi:hypothetical protein